MEGNTLCGVCDRAFSSALRVAFLFGGIVLCGTAMVHAQDLSISPMSWNFGNVLVGDSQKMTFDFLSQGSSETSVYLIGLEDALSLDPPYAFPDHPHDPSWALGPFSFDPATWTHLPIVLPPGDHVFVDVIFSPPAPGDYSAYLYIRGNDAYPPPGVTAFLPIEGSGVLVPVPPAILLGVLGISMAGWLSRRRKS